MPFKHRTETAYMVLLALAVCASGLLAALLPPFPEGLKQWSICIALAVLYPVVLSSTFRENRADKEFRLLHWFPAAIFLLWFLLAVLKPVLPLADIFRLGFFVLWSLPLVVLGLALLSIFAVHVLRRWVLRTIFLSVFLAVFAIGAVASEVSGINPALAQAVFREPRTILVGVRSIAGKLRTAWSPGSRSEDMRPVVVQRASSSTAPFSAAAASSAPSSARRIPPVISGRKPNGLAASGPELPAVLLVTLLSVYSVILHRRARERI